MASSARSSTSTAVVLYDPAASRISIKTHLESVSHDVARRALNSAKWEAGHFPQVPSGMFTDRDFAHFSETLNPPSSLKMDASIDIEIFTSAIRERRAPVLIFSHGYGASSAKYRPLLAELARHGYTVLSLTHPSCVKEIPGLTPEEEAVKTDELAGVMANTIQYVIEEVRKGALNDFGDPDRILLGGHSLGGAASIMVSRGDSAILGCVNLDGFLKGEAKTDGLTQPLLMIIGDYQEDIRDLEQDPEEEAREYAKYMSRSLEEYEMLLHHSPRSEKIVVPRAVHSDFTDQPFQDYLGGQKTLSCAMRLHSIVSSEVVKFLRFC